MPPKRSLVSVRTAFQLIVLGLLLVVSLNYESILDDYALATFHPAAGVVAVEGRLGLTYAARAAFYRAQPQIDEKATFNHDCDTQPHELELGCFFRGHIYILQIDNESLASEMDVVTAHELLHAEWNKMSSADRRTIGAELERVYGGIQDKELQQRMAGYAQSEPGEQDNELHSILGTEFGSLSPLLEQHYARYFTNRQEIVASHEAYLQVFNSRRAELENDLAEIRAEKARLALLNREMDNYRAMGQVSAYNSLVPQQNRMVDDINSRIASYQAAVEEYNALSRSLDSQTITDTETPAQNQ